MKPEEKRALSAEHASPENEVEAQIEKQKGLSTLSLIGTILAAAFGVQSSRARERDFSQRSPWPFIIGGILFGIMFVLTLVFLVSMILPDR